MELTDEKINELKKKANDIRISLIESLIAAGSGHTAGPLDMADIFTVLFFHTLNHNPKKPAWPERDRVVLSNGHICPVLYSTMAHAGYFPVKELKTLRKFGSRLQGHPHRDFLPMLETSSGPLGSGLSQAVGMALALKIDHSFTSNRRIYALLSDGELEAGQTWEAAMLAGKEKLQNLVAVIDRNNIQIEGYTENVMPLESLSDKWRAWNWHVIEIDGHNIEEIADSFETAKAVFEKPTVIIAHTIAGKGIPEFERDYRWHGNPPGKGPTDKVPADKQAKVALAELRTLGGKIESEHQ
ncbi:MAG: transketolase [Candidatus Zambryskibacteria bacterium CG_4_9_14_3_um_filter_42_9]|uniref:Transketolase n=1 Tax=Candidatus Zambryskibacteria bacterium CG22_combo_CG10-13_8_21_14_all_42_17 TaxID=1975118 RepID=A0A2H0BE26_9BACT|nr:MAG: transketolase [Candidatus Zambryskibacteria bacterium CG22_combo_CG10-13_8_21_14_all_42_17]PJA37066.1 MAG: transketolase [Candidatus Zambryskibacteria bacterium CG_4_9_14_3_um_filter_42_9]